MRFLHSMLRVRDLDRSLDFYCRALGLVEVRRTENPAGRYTLVFLAAPGDAHRGEIELTWVPVDGLTISQNIGYKTGKYDEYFAIDGTKTDAANPVNGPWDVIIANDRSGEQLSFPKMNYGGSIAYDWEMAGWDLRAETNYNYRDEL